MQLLAENASVWLLRDALANIGYHAEEYALHGIRYCKFTSPRGRIWMTPAAQVVYPFVTAAAKALSDHKALAYGLAAAQGIRCPQTTVLDAGDAAAAAYDMLASGPVVVKPDNGYASHGLTINVSAQQQLDDAVAKAREVSTRVLVQQQIEGEEVRFVVLDGQVTAAILRQSPRVTGDGISSLSALIDRENQSRQSLRLPYLAYPQLDTQALGLSSDELASVPPVGAEIRLGSATMIRDGASIFDVTAETHPSSIEAVERLANMLGRGFVVVDMFLIDYRQPLNAMNYAFNEFNLSPALKLFYSCRDGRQYDILKQLVPMIDRALHQGEET